MGSINTIKDGLTPETYSIPFQSRKLFDGGIIQNPSISKNLPAEAQKFSAKVRFVGSDSPSIPINWQFAESISALKGLEATILNVLLASKYGIEPQDVVINTWDFARTSPPTCHLLTNNRDHAQLFIMSTVVWTMEHDNRTLTSFDPKVLDYFPSYDIHRQAATYHRNSTTNIYKTKDGRFFHLHGSMNPDPSLDSIGLSHELDAASVEESWEPFKEKLAQIDSQEMGASVMRVTAPHLVDYSSLHCDLNWGKWNTFLDFRKGGDREKMKALVQEADVVISGYRPGVLDKWGFGQDDVLKLCEGRQRGVIYARENCYGWNGPWAYRSG
jgi:hypothetical protein